MRMFTEPSICNILLETSATKLICLVATHVDKVNTKCKNFIFYGFNKHTSSWTVLCFCAFIYHKRLRKVTSSSFNIWQWVCLVENLISRLPWAPATIIWSFTKCQRNGINFRKVINERSATSNTYRVTSETFSRENEFYYWFGWMSEHLNSKWEQMFLHNAN